MPTGCFRGSRPNHVFKLDVENYVYYYYALYWRNTLLCPWSGTIIVAPCELYNLRDYANAVNVGIKDGSLVFCKEKTKQCWRLPPCDGAKVVKEIPLTQITDVVVREPAGGLLPAERLFRVSIQTAGKSGVNEAELEIVGLSEKDAYKLRDQIKGRGGVRTQSMQR